MEVFRCPVSNCDSEKETRKALLIHLLMIHFNKDMELEYRETFRGMKVKKCPDCGMALLDNYLYFIKHIAVDHEKVLKYVNEKQEKCGETDEEPLAERQHQDEDNLSRSLMSNGRQKAEVDREKSKTGYVVNESSSKKLRDPAPEKLDQSFDLRAILDSDSDSD